MKFSLATLAIDTILSIMSGNTCSGYNDSNQPLASTLKLTHPNGGEKFISGGDMEITWEGVSPTDTVRLEYSTDYGSSWNIITYNPSGLKYIWKNIPKATGGRCLIRVTTDNAPRIQWQKCLGGSSGSDNAYSIIETKEGGYVFCGYTGSNENDVSGNHGWWDFWVVKLDQSGQILWQKCFGGSKEDIPWKVIQTTDSGYVVAGHSKSNNGDITGSHGVEDGWIVKLDKSGNLLWQKCLGGNKQDVIFSVIETNDRGLIAAGFTQSNNGDISGNHGKTDAWVIKLDQTGQIQWQKCYGGSGNDGARSIFETNDGGYILACWADSNDADVSGCHGKQDYWILKLDQTGQIQWQKCYGGSDVDEAQSIIQAKDNDYIIAGYTSSDDCDVSGFLGQEDYLIMKINQSGQIVWQKCLGGSAMDDALSIIQTRDSAFVITGNLDSHDGYAYGNHKEGVSDCWIVKLDQSGQILWQKCLGGTKYDYFRSIIETTGGGYICAGYVCSNDGDASGNHSNNDCWIVKLSAEGRFQSDISDDTFSMSDQVSVREEKPFIHGGNNFIKSVYPNPAQNEIVINLDLSESLCTRLYISSVLGENVMDIFSANSPVLGEQSMKADISKLGPGTYFLILETLNQCQSEKFEVVK